MEKENTHISWQLYLLSRAKHIQSSITTNEHNFHLFFSLPENYFFGSKTSQMVFTSTWTFAIYFYVRQAGTTCPYAQLTPTSPTVASTYMLLSMCCDLKRWHHNRLCMYYVHDIRKRMASIKNLNLKTIYCVSWM